MLEYVNQKAILPFFDLPSSIKPLLFNTQPYFPE
jgi:hypothetical protein